MSEEWIKVTRQQVRVITNHGEVLWKVDHQEWSTFRPKEYGSAADNARAAERCRLGTVCRGTRLDAKRDTQQPEACETSSKSAGESVRG
jgi:hypothetical protein